MRPHPPHVAHFVWTRSGKSPVTTKPWPRHARQDRDADASGRSTRIGRPDATEDLDPSPGQALVRLVDRHDGPLAATAASAAAPPVLGRVFARRDEPAPAAVRTGIPHAAALCGPSTNARPLALSISRGRRLGDVM